MQICNDDIACLPKGSVPVGIGILWSNFTSNRQGNSCWSLALPLLVAMHFLDCGSKNFLIILFEVISIPPLNQIRSEIQTRLWSLPIIFERTLWTFLSVIEGQKIISRSNLYKEAIRERSWVSLTIAEIASESLAQFHDSNHLFLRYH